MVLIDIIIIGNQQKFVIMHFSIFRPQAINHVPRDLFQKFEYVNEYITLVADQNLVLSVSETEGRVASVVLAKRRPDDINQKWIIRENGYVKSRLFKFVS